MLAPEEEAFRSEVVEFLAGHGPVDGFFFHEAEHDTAVRALYRALGERGWLSLSWPWPESNTAGGQTSRRVSMLSRRYAHDAPDKEGGPVSTRTPSVGNAAQKRPNPGHDQVACAGSWLCSSGSQP